MTRIGIELKIKSNKKDCQLTKVGLFKMIYLLYLYLKEYFKNALKKSKHKK